MKPEGAQAPSTSFLIISHSLPIVSMLWLEILQTVLYLVSIGLSIYTLRLCLRILKRKEE